MQSPEGLKDSSC
jgi:hypothetical protein